MKAGGRDGHLLTIRMMRYYVAAVEEGTFAAAAARVNIVQPVISGKIRDLERDLGIPLLLRTPAGLETTPAGRDLFDACKRTLEGIQGAVEGVRALRRETAIFGTVRFGITPELGKALLPQILPHFMAAHPGVELVGMEGGAQLESWLEEGRVDLIIGGAGAAHWWISELAGFDMDLVLYSGQPLPGARFAPLSLTEMTDLRLVRPRIASRAKGQIAAQINDALVHGTICAARVVEIEGLLATLAFLRGANWCGIVPAITILEEIAAGIYDARPIAYPLVDGEWRIAHHTDRPPSPATLRFVDALKQAITERAQRWRAMQAAEFASASVTRP